MQVTSLLIEGFDITVIIVKLYIMYLLRGNIELTAQDIIGLSTNAVNVKSDFGGNTFYSVVLCKVGITSRCILWGNTDLSMSATSAENAVANIFTIKE